MPRLEHAEHHASLASTSSNRFQRAYSNFHLSRSRLNFKYLNCLSFRTRFLNTTLLPLRSSFYMYHHNCYSKLQVSVCLFEEPILSFRIMTFPLFQRILILFRFELNDSYSNHRYQNLQRTVSPKLKISFLFEILFFCFSAEQLIYLSCFLKQLLKLFNCT